MCTSNVFIKAELEDTNVADIAKQKRDLKSLTLDQQYSMLTAIIYPQIAAQMDLYLHNCSVSPSGVCHLKIVLYNVN